MMVAPATELYTCHTWNGSQKVLVEIPTVLDGTNQSDGICISIEFKSSYGLKRSCSLDVCSIVLSEQFQRIYSMFYTLLLS